MKLSFRLLAVTAALAAGFLSAPILAAATPAEAGVPSIFVCGDSTAKNNANGGLGWGTPIAAYFDPAMVTVSLDFPQPVNPMTPAANTAPAILSTVLMSCSFVRVRLAKGHGRKSRLKRP